MKLDDLFELKGLKEMDAQEVEFLKRRVADLYGPFHPEVVLQGVYFHRERTPVTVYPEPYDQFHVAVLLPEHQSQEIGRVAHLTHELVHCLYPNGLPSRQATVFEEGLADQAKVHIARELFTQDYPDYDFTLLCGGPGKYLDAFNAVSELAEIEGVGEMRAAVREMRASTGLPFKDIGYDHLRSHFSKAPDELLRRLAERFH